MPSRKQRRRRQKDRRHEYEYVYVDESGTEVEVEDPEPAETKKNGAKGAAPRPRPKQSKGKQQPRNTGGRVVQPPSWERVIKRTAIFIPIMFLAIYMLERGIGLTAQLVVTAQMLLIFIPFSYVMDRCMYKRYLRQTGQEPVKPSR